MAPVSAADAVKAFRSKSITVQTATPVKVKGADGKERDGFKVEMAPLAEAHVLAANDLGGRIVMVTVDGQKHVTTGKSAAAA